MTTGSRGSARPPLARRLDFLRLSASPARAKDPVRIYLQDLSASSARSMMSGLKRVASLIGIPVDQIRWWGIGPGHLALIRAELQKASPAVANQSLSAVRGVVRTAVELGLIEQAHEEQIRRVPLFAHAPAARRAPTPKQLAKLIEAAASERDPKGLRDAALLVVLIAGGLKRSEVLRLRLADYQVASGTLRLGTRTMRLDRGERARLRAWISYRGGAQGPLFMPMRKGGRLERRRMSGQAVAAIVAERASQSGLPSFSPEDLRRASFEPGRVRGG